MSNEKNSALFTQFLANTKDLFTCILSRFMLAGNKFTFNIVSGLVISTVGAMMFSMKSIFDNMIAGTIVKKKEENEETTKEESQISERVEIK